MVTVAIADGSTTLTLSHVGPGSSEITVTAVDGRGGTLPHTFTVKVNEPPVATSISGPSLTEGLEAGAIDLTVPFTDPDTDDLMFTVMSSVPGVVTAEIADGSTMLTLMGVMTGSSEITVTAKDGRGGTVTHTFTVTVMVNRAPTVVVANAIPNQSLSTGFANESINFADTFMDSDDGDALTYTAASSNTGVVTVAIADETVSTLILTEVMPGSSEITVTATDKGDLMVDNTFTVMVSTNRAPTVVDARAIPDQVLNTGFANESIDFTGTFMDSDAGDMLTYTVVSSSTSVVTAAIADEAAPVLTLTEKGGGSSEITVTASDGKGGTVPHMFTVKVNRPPVATAIATQLLNTDFGTHVIDLAVPFTDTDTDVLMYTVMSSVPGVVTAEITDGTMLTLTEVMPGSSEITVTARDGRGGTVTNVFTVMVSTNRAPVVVEGQAIPDRSLNTGFMSESIDFTGTFMDSDAGDVLVFSVSSSDEGVVTAAIAPGGTMLTLTEKGGGSSEITVTADDENGGMVDDVFRVKVNRAPTVVVARAIPDQSLNTGFANESIDFTGTFMDSDVGDMLTYTAVSSTPGVVTVAIADETASTLTLTEVMPGSSEITVTATDEGGLKITDKFTVMVSTNRAPTVVVARAIPDQSLNTGFANESIDFTGTFMDSDAGDMLTYRAVSSTPGVVTVAIADETVSTLTLTEVMPGSSEITVTATDGNGGVVTDVFNVTVTANRAPTVVEGKAIPDQVLSAGTSIKSIAFAGTFTDLDMDVLTFSVSSSDKGVVTAAIIAPGFLITLTKVDSGSSDITVTADDENGGVAMDVFTVKVNRAPVVANRISDLSLMEGFRTREIALAATFTDGDKDVLTLTVNSSNTGVVTAAIAGTTLTITEVGPGSSVITVNADDKNGDVVSDEFTVTVAMVTGVAETRGFRAYPNPASESLTVEMEGTWNLVRIYDFTGRHIHVPVREQGPKKVVLDISGLSAGIYLVKVSGGGGSTVRRLTVKHR